MKQKVYAFTSGYNSLSNTLINQILVSQAFKSSPSDKPPKNKKYNAIWDTGATNTVITEKVVKECNLKEISMTKVHHAGGVSDSNVYLISLYLPNKIVIPNIRVTQGILGSITNADVLIGMDIISKGDFAVSNYEGKTTFSFRIPSRAKIDFAPPKNIKPVQRVGRNALCPCGSGKKYKKCHGKAI